MLEELDNLTTQHLIDCFEDRCPVAAVTEDADPSLFYSEVADRLARRGSPGTAALVALFDRFGAATPLPEEKLAAVLFGLGSVANVPESVCSRIRALIHHESPRIAASAIECLRRRSDSAVEAEIRSSLSSCLPQVAAESIKYLVQMSIDRIKADLRYGLAHHSAIVRFFSVNLIDDLQWTDLVEDARQLANDPDDDVRTLVRAYLKHSR